MHGGGAPAFLDSRAPWRLLNAPSSHEIPALKPSETSALRFPHAEPPAFGKTIAVADGILWARLPLPFRLDHVNIYFIEDEGGFAVLDTGVDTAESRAVWETLLAGPLRGKPLSKIIVTHFHPDHIGLAGWLCPRFDAPLYTSQTSYLSSINISIRPDALEGVHYRDFYLRHGLAPQVADLVATQGHAYLRLVQALPYTFRRIVAGDTLAIGGRGFRLLSGDGHAPEQIMLDAQAGGIFLAADQVLAKITPNVSVWAVEPGGDPLRLYLRSLRALKAEVAPDVLVLPGHQLPFYGLHARIDELMAHHELRCDLILAACRAPHSAAELVPVLFPRPLDPHQMSFAFAETQAHINYLIGRGDLAASLSADGIERVRCV
jgi:glyoxylase-like metal-dependent hydrolase (beta-lactamase superfamily II)